MRRPRADLAAGILFLAFVVLPSAPASRTHPLRLEIFFGN